MAGAGRQNRATEAQAFTRASSGVTRHITTPIVLGGQTVQPQVLLTAFQAALAAEADLDAARTAAKQKQQARDLAVGKARTFLAELHAYAQATYGKTSPILEDFGFKPTVAVVKPVKVKAQAVERGALTRAARHTMGPKQREAIHGEVVVQPAAKVEPPAPTGGR